MDTAIVRLPLVTLSFCLSLYCLGWIQTTKAEPIFHSRDRSDLYQGRAARVQQTQAVSTESEAQAYLIHYGYLNCTLRQRRESGLASILGVIKEEMEIQEPRECSTVEFSEAMSKFQSSFGLPNTGTLNDETKSIMSYSRCGNKDSGEEEEGRSFSQARSANVGRQHVIRRRAVDYIERQTRAAVDAERDKAAPSQLLWSGVHPVIIDEATPKRRTRADMYHELKSNLRQEQWSKFLKQENPKERRTREASTSRDKRSQRRRREVAASNDTIVDDDLPDNQAQNTARLEWSWRLLEDGLSGKIPLNNQRSILGMAYRIWSEVIPIKFVENNNGAINNVDVTMGFGKHVHLDCTKPFDGPGGVIAHSYACHTQADDQQMCVHIDEDECYRGFTSMTDRTALDQGCIYLLQVALHEIGHVLGLRHSREIDSVMYPVMPAKFSELELSSKDRAAAQGIWGVCGGRFDTVFDWVRKTVSLQYTKEGFPYYSYSYYYNSYFYRDSYYWMYENRYDRPRYGDPLYIPTEWRGIPVFIDAATQILFNLNPSARDNPNYEIRTLFFKDDLYYEYDAEEDMIMPGYPREIADDFSPDNSSYERVPDNLDSVYYDSARGKLLFFKGEDVWMLDPVEYMVHQQKDPLIKKRFNELFIPHEDANFTISGNIDAIYFSNAFGKTFLFVAEQTYRVVSDDRQDAYILYEDSQWYERWHDICDVE